MPENGWRFVDRLALLCLIIGTAGVIVVLLGNYGLNWRPATTLAAMILLGAMPLVVSAWLFLLANRQLGEQLRQNQKAGTIGRLAGDVAHDFNNLLARILGAAEMLETRVGQSGIEREMVNTIVSATHQAGKLSSKLMVAARNQADSTASLDLQEMNQGTGVIATTAQTEAAIPHGHELILLIEDEAAIRALASMVLVQLGYEVILASGGRKGIELYEKERGRIRAVVLDMVMPDMDGLEVLRQLKRIDPAVKVAIAAGYITAQARADLQAAGAAAIIQKPYRMNEIGAVLSGMLAPRENSRRA